MATINLASGDSVHSLLVGYKAAVVKKVDFSTFTAAAQDVLQCINVEAGMLVTNVRVVISTASGGTLTATVGDGSGANSYDASVNLNATAGTATAGLGGTDSYVTTGKFYTAADTIDLTLSNNAPGTTGVFYVIVEYSRVY